MRLIINHHGHFQYDRDVQASENWVHLQPPFTPCQTVIHHTLQITPDAQDLKHLQDQFGNPCTHWHLRQPYNALTVETFSEVVTWVLPFQQSSVSWETTQTMQNIKEVAPYLDASSLVPIGDAFAKYAKGSFRAELSLAEAAIDLCQRIKQDFKYEPGSTRFDTPADEVLANRRGVCQDFAHVLIACFRSLGLAASFVGGYLLKPTPPEQAQFFGPELLHAWVRLFIPDLTEHPCQGWLHLDPTNLCYNLGSPGENYIQLAVGRDFDDVPPLTGNVQGGGAFRRDVRITVEPVVLVNPEDSVS